jgi:hypothetical protein
MVSCRFCFANENYCNCCNGRYIQIFDNPIQLNTNVQSNKKLDISEKINDSVKLDNQIIQHNIILDNKADEKKIYFFIREEI